MANKKDENILALCDSLSKVDNRDEMYKVMKDLTTPSELDAFAERWRVCKLLAKEDLSYREIGKLTKASLTTIGRVARFLRSENYGGYKALLDKNGGE